MYCFTHELSLTKIRGHSGAEAPLNDYHQSQVVRFDTYELDLESGELRKGGRPLRLQAQPTKVLIILVSHAGKLVGREELRRQIWDGTVFVDFEQGLNFCIRQIRSVLNDEAVKPRFIETVPRRGYRFIGSVEPSGSLNSVGEPEVTASAVSPAGSRGLPKGIVALLTSSVLLLLGGAGWWYHRSSVQNATIDSVAVLPFVNSSADPNAEYLSDGITVSLINRLTQLRGLRVVARSTVFRFKGRDTNPQEIGRDLHVSAVVTGRVQQLVDTVIIQTELVDVEKGSQLWGGQYNRKLADVFATQEDIAQEISHNLRLRLTGKNLEGLAKSYTPTSEAYQDYLKGRYWWNKGTDEGDNKGIDYF